jgi:hypothetical protein
MNQSLIIALSKKMRLLRRISETSRQIDDWFNSFEVKFDDKNDKLHFEKMGIKESRIKYLY